MLKALIVDDEYLVRTGIRETIDWAEYGVEIVGEASNGLEGLDLALLHRPDVIMTDVRMPYMNGLEFIEKIREHNLHCGIIVLSGYDEFQYAQEAIRHGASTYLLKPVNIEELAEAVIRVGQQINEKEADRIQLLKFKDEVDAISSQFWLDLLFGRISDPALIREKYEWLNIAMPTEDKLMVAVISIIPDSVSVADYTTQAKWSAVEQQIRLTVDAKSLSAIAIVRSAPTEWTLICHSNQTSLDFVSALYSFGYAVIANVKEAAGFQATVGFHESPDPYMGIHTSCVKAREAARKSISGLGGVLFESDDERSGPRREVRDALAYIRLHYSDNITADLVAETVHVSSTHLMHLFRKDLNKTFYECLTEYRIDEAKRLLRHTSYRVYEVGLNVGFGDSKYFSQIFRKMTGMSPSEYAKYHQ
ncbi:response regulator transcription factor [Cohnella silvisoli]|uniref:Response regulator n=1 Tax=Cohnella silvisoli TaxID=2873699 RepID=A0ABV1L3A0_9BACL|nr:response regulator [Cohnella silvisoli]MCD9026099.1 response regulator [Cohnella silvisoli]